LRWLRKLGSANSEREASHALYKPVRKLENGKRVKYPCWYIGYKDEHGKHRAVKGFKDRQATEAKGREIEKRIERILAGLPVVNQEKLNAPLGPLIKEYLAELTRTGRSHHHTSIQELWLKRLTKECSWATLRSINAERLRKWIEAQGTKPAARTINAYRDAAVAFCNWCIKQNWLQENPLNKIPKAKEPGNRKRYPRRAFTVSEFRQLLEANPGRKTVYLTAGLSGLRKGELYQLEKRDLSPFDERPTWHLRPEIAKGRRKDVVPIIWELLPELQLLWRKAKKPTDRLFPGIPMNRTFHRDLKRAGIRRIDDEGRRVVFHSLRYFFCTLLAKHLPIQVVRLLMRHKNIKQTCDLYMDLGLTDVAEALIDLPTSLLTDQSPKTRTPKSRPQEEE
jgi:integrase